MHDIVHVEISHPQHTNQKEAAKAVFLVCQGAGEIFAIIFFVQKDLFKKSFCTYNIYKKVKETFSLIGGKMTIENKLDKGYFDNNAEME